jgi:hypothetical protein
VVIAIALHPTHQHHFFAEVLDGEVVASVGALTLQKGGHRVLQFALIGEEGPRPSSDSPRRENPQAGFLFEGRPREKATSST